MKDKWTRYQYRKERTRGRLAEKSGGRPRLTVHRSLKYIYAQVVDDAQEKTLAAASSLSKELAAGKKSAKNVEAAKKVGELLAKKAWPPASRRWRSTEGRTSITAGSRPSPMPPAPADSSSRRV